MALKFPGAKIDREMFLQKTYEKYCDQATVDNILRVGAHEAGIELTLMERMAGDTIKQHTGIAAGTSFVAGIPGGLVMAATIPADVAQFYYHVLVAAQKLAYIFGLKSIDDTGNNFREVLTVFIGVMAGVGEAEHTLNEVIDSQFNKTLAHITLGKILDKTVARIAAVIGVQLTKKSAGRIIARIVPFVSGIVSGGMTLFSYVPMCNRLKHKLYDSIEIKKNNGTIRPL
ncbi:MAG: hypothetical protein LBC88_01615 [Spirochaetaceae bacterium]|nr:hypothetical protein [Spirochaetaceae bacterium]